MNQGHDSDQAVFVSVTIYHAGVSPACYVFARTSDTCYDDILQFDGCMLRYAGKTNVPCPLPPVFSGH